MYSLPAYRRFRQSAAATRWRGRGHCILATAAQERGGQKPSCDRQGRWIIGFGYSQLKEQRHPNRDELDQVSTTLPIMIVHQSGYLASLLKMRAKPRQDRATAAAVGAVHFKIE